MKVIEKNENKASEVTNREELRKKYLERINRALDYIKKNIQENISLEDLADTAFFHHFTFTGYLATLLVKPLMSMCVVYDLKKGQIYC
jgi:hypothetical protein